MRMGTDTAVRILVAAAAPAMVTLTGGCSGGEAVVKESFIPEQETSAIKQPLSNRQATDPFRDDTKLTGPEAESGTGHGLSFLVSPDGRRVLAVCEQPECMECVPGRPHDFGAGIWRQDCADPNLAELGRAWLRTISFKHFARWAAQREGEIQ